MKRSGVMLVFSWRNLRLLLLVLFGAWACIEQSHADTIVVTFPAPSGYYNNLTSNTLSSKETYLGIGGANVGIGTLTPAATLDVNGNLITRGALTSTGQTTLARDSGNVGIGTASPYGALHVLASGQTLNLQSTGVNDTVDVQFYKSGDASGAFKWDLSYRGPLNGDDLFLYRSGGVVMTWKNSNGNVGINTTSPAATLDVNGPVVLRDQVLGGNGAPAFVVSIIQDNCPAASYPDSPHPAAVGCPAGYTPRSSWYTGVNACDTVARATGFGNGGTGISQGVMALCSR